MSIGDLSKSLKLIKSLQGNVYIYDIARIHILHRLHIYTFWSGWAGFKL